MEKLQTLVKTEGIRVVVEVELGDNKHRVIREGSNGCYVIAEKPYSLNAGDTYLTVVLAVFESQYVTWYENHSCGGFHGGHYFEQRFEEALKDFLERGSFPWEMTIKEGK